MVELTAPASLHQLDEIYDAVEPQLEALYAKAGGLSALALYELVATQQATLHLIGKPVQGVVVCQWNETNCHILAGVALNGHTTGIEELYSVTADYAKQLGCYTISFTSPRRAWLKKYKAMGCKIEEIRYVRDLTNE